MSTLEEEIFRMFQDALKNGANLRCLRLGCEVEGWNRDIAQAKVELLELRPDTVRLSVLKIIDDCLRRLTPTPLDYYGDSVRVSITAEEYTVQQKIGSAWKTRKAFPQSRDFAATEAREYAQALARANLGGH